MPDEDMIDQIGEVDVGEKRVTWKEALQHIIKKLERMNERD